MLYTKDILPPFVSCLVLPLLFITNELLERKQAAERDKSETRHPHKRQSRNRVKEEAIQHPQRALDWSSRKNKYLKTKHLVFSQVY